MSGLPRSVPVLPPLWCSSSIGCPSKNPPAFPPFARNSTMIFALKSSPSAMAGSSRKFGGFFHQELISRLARHRRQGPADTSGLAVDTARPDPGRAVVPLTGAQEAVLVYDAGLDPEPHLVRLTAAAASMALEHSRL